MPLRYETMIIYQPPSANDLTRLLPWECFAIVPWQGEYLLYLKRDEPMGLAEVRRTLQEIQSWGATAQPRRPANGHLNENTNARHGQ